MKNSGSLSETATPPPSAQPSREGFALSGPSVVLDPRLNAVRPDLADIRLAAYVFAPHYAAPLSRRIEQTVSLRAGRDLESEAIATLAAGDAFEVLECAGTLAWGVAPAAGLVGYVPLAALASAA